MSEAKHTPGPWTFRRGPDDEGFEFTLGDTSERTLVEQTFHYAEVLYPEDGDQYETAEANARLMVAAPDLLTALEEMVEECEVWPDGTLAIDAPLLAAARAAIAKAKGK